MNAPIAAKGKRGRKQSQAPKLNPVDASLSESVERQAYRSIRQGLMSGLVAPGTALTSRSLAQQLNVSVQPVRDALKRLEADGVVEGRPQSGFFLRDLTPDEYWEITEIRVRLEGLAGRHAVATITDETIEHLKSINEQMARLTLPQDYLAENYRFHFMIYREARRPNLIAIIENLWMRIGPALHHHPHEFNLTETLKKHAAIIDALSNRDADAAETAIAHDLQDAAKLVVLNLG